MYVQQFEMVPEVTQLEDIICNVPNCSGVYYWRLMCIYHEAVYHAHKDKYKVNHSSLFQTLHS